MRADDYMAQETGEIGWMTRVEKRRSVVRVSVEILLVMVRAFRLVRLTRVPAGMLVLEGSGYLIRGG